MNLMLGMMKQLKHSGEQSELILVLSHLLSVQMHDEAIAQNKKNCLENLARAQASRQQQSQQLEN